MRYQYLSGKLEDWSHEYAGPKFHAVLCDPPYGLKFMGKDWDVVSAKEWGEALLPHLYPGALCLMFGGTRKWHRLAVGMEEAGFEVWDTLMWLYGQGFPKGQDISKLIDKKNGDSREVLGRKQFVDGSFARKTQKFGGKDVYDPDAQSNESNLVVTAPGSEQSAPWSGHKTCALKPAWEPILAFRVPAKQTYADLALEYGSGCLNIDGARIGADVMVNQAARNKPGGSSLNMSVVGMPDDAHSTVAIGRYPANLLLDEESAALLDEQTGTSTSGQWDGRRSRFFYCAKASTSERNAGCDQLPLQISGGMAGTADQSLKTGSGNERNNKARNHHPTVKPLALTQYLATLLLPPVLDGPRRLLVPFAGSGSEMIGALKAGWDEVVGIEQDTEQGYSRIAEARLAHHIGEA